LFLILKKKKKKKKKKLCLSRIIYLREEWIKVITTEQQTRILIQEINPSRLKVDHIEHNLIRSSQK
jgi:hypothetical protein